MTQMNSVRLTITLFSCQLCHPKFHHRRAQTIVAEGHQYTAGEQHHRRVNTAEIGARLADLCVILGDRLYYAELTAKSLP